MKLEKVLDELNSFEKNSFLKIIDSIIDQKPQKEAEVDRILSGENRQLKNIDHINIVKVFNLVEAEFTAQVHAAFEKTESQFDLLFDIISRDGNCLMKYDWFSRLYEAEIKSLKKSIKLFNERLNSSKEIDPSRLRDYTVYKACLNTAYTNDIENNSELKVTEDENSILSALSDELDLSQEEVKLMNYDIVPLEKRALDNVIDDLKNIGVVFYSKKNNLIFVPDEIVRVIRKVRKKHVADKYYRRVLKQVREPLINRACRVHGVDWKQSFDEKIKQLIKEGVSFKKLLSEDLFKPDETLTERKAFFKELCDSKLMISPPIKGATLEEKIQNLILYFESIEKDEKVGISMDGYEKLLQDLKTNVKALNGKIRKEFELQDEDVLKPNLLVDYNIKPRDVLELMSSEELNQFCDSQGISKRGNSIANMLEEYKDSENLYLENFELIAHRDHNGLKDNGIQIKDADIGNKFEALTRSIFDELGFNVNEDFRKQLNTRKDKVDILLSVGENEVIIVECKTAKDKNYNKFSAVSRQLKSYNNLAKQNDLVVRRVLLVGPDFTDDFINECGMEIELEITLIRAASLRAILEAFRQSKHNKFPDALLTRDLIVQEDRIIKAILK